MWNNIKIKSKFVPLILKEENVNNNDIVYCTHISILVLVNYNNKNSEKMVVCSCCLFSYICLLNIKSVNILRIFDRGKKKMKVNRQTRNHIWQHYWVSLFCEYVNLRKLHLLLIFSISFTYFICLKHTISCVTQENIM